MFLEQATQVATIIEAFVVAISVIFIWYEIRQDRKLTKSNHIQSLVELSSPLNLELIRDKEVAGFWVNGAKAYDDMDAVTKYRYQSLITWWLILHENIYYQWKEGFLTDSYYSGWENDLRDFTSAHELWRFWPTISKNYQVGFKEYVTRLIDMKQPGTVSKVAKE